MAGEERIVKLEGDIVEIKIAVEVNKRDIKEVKDSVTKIEGNTSKLVWLVGSALIITLLNLIIKGGVSI